MRILILKDSLITDIKRSDAALERIKKDYVGITPVSWQYQDRNFDNLEWELYNAVDLGLKKSYITAQTKIIWDTYNEEFDHVIFLIHPDYWKDGGQAIGGWNMGLFYNHYQVQLCKQSKNDEWLYKIYAMEIIHSMNDFAMGELGENFTKIGGVRDFDNDMVHGLDPRWGILQKDGTFFTDYQYRPLIEFFGNYIRAFYDKRRVRYEMFINGLVIKLNWLQRLIQWYRNGKIGKQPTPVTEAELEGKVEHHTHNH